MTCSTVGCMFCTKMMSYKTSFYEGSVFFFQAGAKAARPVSVPAASPGGLRPMGTWWLYQEKVISLSDRSPALLWV